MTDVVVIGGGINGLVAASYLARHGKTVVLFERRPELGGISAPFEFADGYSVPGLWSDTSAFRHEIAQALALDRDGAERDSTPFRSVCTDGTASLELVRGADTELSGGDVTAEDQEQFWAWRQAVVRFSPVVRQLLGSPPIPLTPHQRSDWWQLGKQGLSLRKLGKTGMLELLRVLPMSAADWLGEFFQNPLLSETLALAGVFGGFFGPRAAGTAANLLFSECVSERQVKGGTPALLAALKSNCLRHRVELRPGAEVARIVLESGSVRGVRLASGEDVPAGSVLATCHPQLTFLKLLRPVDLSLKLEDQVRCIRTRGTAARIHLGLNAPLAVGPRDADAVCLGTGSVAGLEQIFDAAKYGRLSETLHVQVERTANRTPELAPEGGEVLGIWVHSVPYRIDPSWNRQVSQQLLPAVIQKLCLLDPEIEQKVVAAQVLTPYDLEESWGLVGGQIFHAERTLDQALMLRPASLLARYRTPVAGLWAGGSANHPGGAASGMPGLLAADRLLRS